MDHSTKRGRKSKKGAAPTTGTIPAPWTPPACSVPACTRPAVFYASIERSDHFSSSDRWPHPELPQVCVEHAPGLTGEPRLFEGPHNPFDWGWARTAGLHWPSDNTVRCNTLYQRRRGPEEFLVVSRITYAGNLGEPPDGGTCSTPGCRGAAAFAVRTVDWDFYNGRGVERGVAWTAVACEACRSAAAHGPELVVHRPDDDHPFDPDRVRAWLRAGDGSRRDLGDLFFRRGPLRYTEYAPLPGHYSATTATPVSPRMVGHAVTVPAVEEVRCGPTGV